MFATMPDSNLDCQFFLTPESGLWIPFPLYLSPLDWETSGDMLGMVAHTFNRSPSAHRPLNLKPS